MAETRPGGTATVTQIEVSTAAPVTLQAENVARFGLIIYNASANKDLYVKFGTDASLTDYTTIVGKTSAHVVQYPAYRGIVTGIWPADATGYAYVTEIV